MGKIADLAFYRMDDTPQADPQYPGYMGALGRRDEIMETQTQDPNLIENSMIERFNELGERLKDKMPGNQADILDNLFLLAGLVTKAALFGWLQMGNEDLMKMVEDIDKIEKALNALT